MGKVKHASCYLLFADFVCQFCACRPFIFLFNSSLFVWQRTETSFMPYMWQILYAYYYSALNCGTKCAADELKDCEHWAQKSTWKKVIYTSSRQRLHCKAREMWLHFFLTRWLLDDAKILPWNFKATAKSLLQQFAEFVSVSGNRSRKWSNEFRSSMNEHKWKWQK